MLSQGSHIKRIIAACEWEIRHKPKQTLEIWLRAQRDNDSFFWLFASKIADFHAAHGNTQMAENILTFATHRQCQIPEPFWELTYFLLKHKQWQKAGEALFGLHLRAPFSNPEEFKRKMLALLDDFPELKFKIKPILQGAKKAASLKTNLPFLANHRCALEEIRNFFI